MIERITGKDLMGIIQEHYRDNIIELTALEYNELPRSVKTFLFESGFKLYDLSKLFQKTEGNYYFINPTINETVSSMNKQVINYVKDEAGLR